MAQRFRFPLEKLLKMKKQLQRQAEIALTVRRAELDAALVQIEQLKEKQMASSMELQQSLARGEIKFLQPAQRYLERLQDDINSAFARAEQARSALNDAICQRNQRAKEVETLEELRARRFAEFRKEQNRRSQDDLNERTVQRQAWLKKQTGETVHG